MTLLDITDYAAGYIMGREAGAADRLLGERSEAALTSPVPGYADGYRDGLAGR